MLRTTSSPSRTRKQPLFLLVPQPAKCLLLAALVVGAVDPDVTRTVDVVPNVDADPLTLMHKDLDWLINVMLIAVLSRIAITAKPKMTN